MLGRQEGQIIPALVMVMLALLALGMLFFQVGRAAVFSTEAQTAADAAALAAARSVEQQLEAQVASSGSADLALVDSNAVLGAAQSYAAKNDARVTRIDRVGVDVKVWVTSAKALGKGAKPLGKQDAHADAKARARVGLVVPDAGPEEPDGSQPVSGAAAISAAEWDALAQRIASPPGCADVVALGRLLRAHGYELLENAALGDPPGAGVHAGGSWHYRCGGSGAIDVNHDQGDEGDVLDALVGPLHKLGFRTIWRTTGHYDHLHVDASPTPSIGAGAAPGGAAGPLEDTTLRVSLIDWNADYLDFSGFGIGGSGSYGGAPDPAVARAICSVLNQYGAPAKVRLAAYEAAIVESGVHNLNYGDRDSLGVFQQRPSAGWGTPAQILDPIYASTMFITRAIAANGGQSAGQLAQDVQVSAFPDRYDAVQSQALALETQYCGGTP